MEEKYKLTYFPGRGGAEICRLTFAAAGVEFEDERIQGEQWHERKPKMPMKALPVLTIKSGGTETIYCQSGAISKYIAKTNGLFGATNIEGFRIDETFDSVVDIQREFFKFLFEKDEDKKAESKKALVEVTVPKLNDFVIDRKKKYGQDSGFIIGSEITLADIAVFNIVDQIIMRDMRDLLEKCAALLEHREFIKTNPRIAKWLEKRPKSEF